MKAKISFRSIFGYLLIGISVIMLSKSLMLCFSNDIWYDELFTVGMIEHSYGDLIAFTAKDVHPPLYYCIVKFVVELCKLIMPAANTVVSAKIASILPYFILFIYSVTFIRKRFGIFIGGFLLFCVISMPQLSAYTVEIRMYSWAILFVTAAFLHAYAVVTECRSDKARLHNAALVLYGLAAAYTHYFACVAVVMVYIYVFAAFFIQDRRRIRQWIACVSLSIAGYTPWLYALYKQITTVSEDYWILPLSWRSLGGCVKFLMKPMFTNEVLNIVLAVVMFAVYVFIVLRGMLYEMLCREREDCGNGDLYIIKQKIGFMMAGAGVLAGLVLFGFAASMILRPIFIYRYMIPALGCFWMSLAVGLDVLAEQETEQQTSFFMTIKRKIITAKVYSDKIYKGIITAVCALIVLIGLRDYCVFMWEEEYRILQMKNTAEMFHEIDAEDILIFNFDQVQMVAGYYIDNDNYLWYGQPEILIQEICGEKGILDEDIVQVKGWISQGRKVWFAGSFNSREDIVEEWRTAGITVDETGSYLLERYWFNMYELSLTYDSILQTL